MSSTWINKVFPPLLKKKNKYGNVWRRWRESRRSLCYNWLQESPGINIQDLVALLSILAFRSLSCLTAQLCSMQAFVLEAEGDSVSSQKASTAHDQTSNYGQNGGCCFLPVNLLQALPALPFTSSWPVTWEPTSHTGKHVPCLMIHGLCPQVLVAQLVEYLPE